MLLPCLQILIFRIPRGRERKRKQPHLWESRSAKCSTAFGALQSKAGIKILPSRNGKEWEKNLCRAENLEGENLGRLGEEGADALGIRAIFRIVWNMNKPGCSPGAREIKSPFQDYP